MDTKSGTGGGGGWFKNLLHRLDSRDQSTSSAAEHHQESSSSGMKVSKSGSKVTCNDDSGSCNGTCDQSVIEMIKDLDSWGSNIDPTQENWIDNLKRLMNKFFINSNNVNVKLRVLDIISICLLDFGFIFEEILIESIIIEHLSKIEFEKSIDVRERAVQLVTQLLLESRNSSNKINELFSIINLILNRPFTSPSSSSCLSSSSCDSNSMSSSTSSSKSSTIVIASTTTADVASSQSELNQDVNDIMAAISGLQLVFVKHVKRSQPVIALKAFHVLVEHLKRYYVSDVSNSNCYICVKQKILTFLTSIRVNGLGQVGLCETLNEDEIDFSPFVLGFQVDTMSHGHGHTHGWRQSTSSSGSNTSPPNTPLVRPSMSNVSNSGHCVLNLSEMFHSFVEVLDKEKNWTLLKNFFLDLRTFMTRNPNVLTMTKSWYNNSNNKMNNSDLSKRTICNDIAFTICKLLQGDKFDTLVGKPDKFTKSDFSCLVYPLLFTMVVHGRQLDGNNQKELILSIQNGLQNRHCHQKVVQALTCCMMEMDEQIMEKLLSPLLVKISQMSSTKIVAVPKLDFLSNLLLFPKLYSNFTSEQYMTIFAIICPYTNLSEFGDFTAALAHRVIAMWFLNCKISCRKQFVGYIRKNLEQTLNRSMTLNTPEDYRPRSSSVTNRRTPGESPGTRHPPTPTHAFSPLNVPLPQSPGPLTPTLSAISSAFSFATSTSSVTTSNNGQATNSNHGQSNCSNLGRTPEREKENVSKLLFEACMELLSRYTYGMTSSAPPSNPYIEFLFKKSQSQSWIFGKELITITTSHCSSRAMSNTGLCKNCYSQCQCAAMVGETMTNCGQVVKDDDLDRRRHQSAVHTSSSGSVLKAARMAYDDSDLEVTSTSSSNPPVANGNQCHCWCQGWAQVTIRKTTGKTSFLMRIENSLNTPCFTSPHEVPFPDILNVYTSSNSKVSSITTSPIKEFKNGSSSSSGSTFKRVSSSPDIETSPLEEGIDVANQVETQIEKVTSNGSNSSNFGSKLSRATSLGKADSSSSNRPGIVNRSPSLKKAPNSPTRRVSIKESLPEDVHEVKLRKPLDVSKVTSNGSASSSETLVDMNRRGSVKPLSPRIVHDDSMRERSSTYSVSGLKKQVNKSGHEIGHARVSGNHELTHATSTCGEPFTRSSGLNPSFIFLQLFYNSCFRPPGSEAPLLLASNEINDRAVRLLDLITPYETHKIGIVYVARGQDKSKIEILKNPHGSYRYQEFLRKMGNLIRLENIEQSSCFLGGLSQDGSDGIFTYCWSDHLTQVVFHVATLMPFKDTDVHCNNKIRHIGNDHVCIIYNDSGKKFDKNVLTGDKCQYLKVCIVITPMDCDVNVVEIQTDESLAKMIGASEPLMISDKNLPINVRQTAIHANLAAEVFKKRETNDTFISNWVERLKHLNRLKEKAIQQLRSQQLLRSPSLEPSSELSSSSNLTFKSPGSISMSSMTSNSASQSSRPRSTTISALNKMMHDEGITLNEPVFGLISLQDQESKTHITDDFTNYT